MYQIVDFVIPVIALVALISYLISISPIFSPYSKDDNKIKAPVEFTKLRLGYRNLAMLNHIMYLTLIILSFVSSILVLYIATSCATNEYMLSRIIIYNSLTLLFSILNITYAPLKVSLKYREAYLIINKALLEYEYAPKEKPVPITILSVAVDEAERAIIID